MPDSKRPPAPPRETDEHVIRTLYDIASHAEVGFDEQARRLLVLGCERFDMEIGILSQGPKKTPQ